MAPLLSPNGDGRYQVRWTSNGIPQVRVFTSRTQARRFHRVCVDRPLTMPVEQVVARWADGRHAPATRKRIEHTCRELLRPFFRDTPIESITPDQIRTWLDWLHHEHDYSPSTIRQHFCVLRCALTWAVDALLVPTNPCTAVTAPPVPKVLPAMAVTRLPQPRPAPARDALPHHRDGRPLADLRRAVSSAASAEELTAFLRRLDVDPD
jgi:hypothetical protein